jgi:hypothetical protein
LPYIPSYVTLENDYYNWSGHSTDSASEIINSINNVELVYSNDASGVAYTLYFPNLGNNISLSSTSILNSAVLEVYVGNDDCSIVTDSLLLSLKT